MVDFVPDPCVGISIFQCFTLRDCSLEELIADLENPVGDVSAGFDSDFLTLSNVETELDAIDACITAAIVAAFTIAGEPYTPPPASGPPVDFTSTSTELDGMVDEILTPLGALDTIFTLEDDGTKITRIISA